MSDLARNPWVALLAELGVKVVPVVARVGGIDICTDPGVPPDQIHIYQNHRMVGRIVNIGDTT